MNGFAKKVLGGGFHHGNERFSVSAGLMEALIVFVRSVIAGRKTNGEMACGLN